MSTERDAESIRQQAEAAVFGAQRLLDPETGAINYDAFSTDQLAALETGPGIVARPAEQRPVHLQPDLIAELEGDEDEGIDWDGEPETYVVMASWQLFLRDCANFRCRFWRDGDGLYAASNAANHAVQRFKILFPDLDAAAVELVKYHDEKSATSQANFYEFTRSPAYEQYGRFMQFAYSVISQLVDLDDPSGNTTVEHYGTNNHLLN